MRKLVSILIPSRGRPEGFNKAVRSIRETASDMSRVEILARLDHCDPRLADYRFGSDIHVRIGVRGRGYPDLNLWYTELDKMASGLFCWMLNDDVTIEGNGWDGQILQAAASIQRKQSQIMRPEFNVLGQSHYREDSYTPFPLTPREWYRGFGYPFWPHPPDTAATEICVKQNLWPEITLKGITVNHQRPDDAGMGAKDLPK